MIPVLIVGHGGFADGLRDAVEMILGPQDALAALALRPDEDPATLAERVDQSLAALGVGPDGGAIVLADLFGASPANAASSLLLRRPGLHVLTGVNLPMALELLVQREGLPDDGVAELAGIGLETGREGIKSASDVVRAAYARVQAGAAPEEAR